MFGVLENCFWHVIRNAWGYLAFSSCVHVFQVVTTRFSSSGYSSVAPIKMLHKPDIFWSLMRNKKKARKFKKNDHVIRQNKKKNEQHGDALK